MMNSNQQSSTSLEIVGRLEADSKRIVIGIRVKDGAIG